VAVPPHDRPAGPVDRELGPEETRKSRSAADRARPRQLDLGPHPAAATACTPRSSRGVGRRYVERDPETPQHIAWCGWSARGRREATTTTSGLSASAIQRQSWGDRDLVGRRGPARSGRASGSRPHLERCAPPRSSRKRDAGTAGVATRVADRPKSRLDAPKTGPPARRSFAGHQQTAFADHRRGSVRPRIPPRHRETGRNGSEGTHTRIVPFAQTMEQATCHPATARRTADESRRSRFVHAAQRQTIEANSAESERFADPARDVGSSLRTNRGRAGRVGSKEGKRACTKTELVDPALDIVARLIGGALVGRGGRAG